MSFTLLHDFGSAFKAWKSLKKSPDIPDHHSGGIVE